jgi:hypothetical protein
LPGAVARFPSLVSTHAGRAVIAGNAIPIFGPDTMPENSLIVWQLDRTRGDTSLGRPPGTFRFDRPRVFVDAKDQLRLIWGEPKTGAPPITTDEWSSRKQQPSTLWAATYTPGSGWSSPHQVFAGRELQWNYAAAATHRSATHDPWLLSVTDDPLPMSGPRRIVLLRLEHGKIAATTIETPHLAPSYTSLVSAGRELYLGIISPVPDTLLKEHGASDWNSVLLLVSHDAGRTWDPVRVVSRSGQNSAYWIRTFISSGGALHLVWRQEWAGGGEVFRHIRSTDGGRSWSAPDDLPSPGMTNEFRAVMDACGTLHLVHEHMNPSGLTGHLDYATIGEAGWSPVEHLFREWDVTDATLQLAPDGRLRLVFVAKRPGAPNNAPWIAMYSELERRRN